MNKDRIGENNVTKEGYQIKITKYNDSKNVYVKFEDEHKTILKCRYSHFKSGSLKNPNKRTIYDIGYFGIGKYKSRVEGIKTAQYITWHSMMLRCYDEKLHLREPSYTQCKVCDEWHNFQNFAKWYNENYYEIGNGQRMELDKDIIINKNKTYSPSTCIFIPKILNTILNNNKATRGEYPLGVHVRRENGKFISRYHDNLIGKRIYLGDFETIDEAFYVYKREKEKYIKRVANHYMSKIPKVIYNALMIFEIGIKD